MSGHRTIYWTLSLLVIFAGCVSGGNSEIQYPEPEKPHYYYDVLAYGDYLYAVSPWGLDIFRTGAGSLRRIGGVKTPGEAQTLALSGSVLFVSDTLGRLHILDVSIPSRPSKIAELELNHTAQRIVISGKRAYLACVSSGLVILDVSTLRPVGLYKPVKYSYPKSVDVQDELLYLTDFAMRLYVARVTNDSVEFLYFVPTTSVPHDVVIAGDHAYVASSDGGVDVYRMAGSRLVHHQNIPLPGFALRLATYGDYLLVTLANRGVAILKILEDGGLELVAEYDTPGNAYGIAVSDGRAYVADYNGGIAVLDLRQLPGRVPVKVFPPEVNG